MGRVPPAPPPRAAPTSICRQRGGRKFISNRDTTATNGPTDPQPQWDGGAEEERRDEGAVNPFLPGAVPVAFL